MQVDRQPRLQVGHAGSVEVGLERQIHPLAIHPLQDGRRHLVDPLVAGVHGTSRSLRQLDGLAPCEPLAQVPVTLVGGIDSPVLGGNAAQPDQLLEAGVGARLVVQPQAQRPGAGVQPGTGAVLHGAQLGGGRMTRVPAHRRHAHRAVRHLRQHVEGSGAAEAVQVGVDGGPVCASTWGLP